MKHILYLLLFIVAPVISSAQTQEWVSTAQQEPAFVENNGQITDQEGKLRNDVKYIYNAPGFKLILKDNSFSYELYSVTGGESADRSEATGYAKESFSNELPEEIKCNTHRVDVKLKGANENTRILAEELNSAYANYYLAHTPEEGVTRVRSYNKITYRNIYENIDFVFYAKEGFGLKYDIIMHPGGRLKDVKLVYEGMNSLKLQKGRLEVSTMQGNVKESIPYSFIKESGQEVNVSYLLKEKEVSFNARYKSDQTLIIDPQLEWATYYTGGKTETGLAVKTDTLGYLYFIGHTTSTSKIATAGSYLDKFAGARDVYVVKFTSAGERVWGTYIGGSSGDGYNEVGLTIDAYQRLYLNGYTSSTSGIATSNAYKTSLSGTQDGYFIRLDTSGFRTYGTYFGGEKEDDIKAIVTDVKGNVYITGNTNSTTGIATQGANKTTLTGAYDIFIAKFDSGGNEVWSTYHGGEQVDDGESIDADMYGNIYVGGHTHSKSGISTPYSFQPNKAYYGGSSSDSNHLDVFLLKMDTNGALIWSTYFGGKEQEVCTQTKCSGDEVYICGVATKSASQRNAGDLSTPGAYKRAPFYMDGFIAKFDSSGQRQWSTYFGGDYSSNNDKIDQIRDMDVDNAGSPFIVGVTLSDSLSTDSSLLNQGNSGYIAKFSANGKFLWASYLGGDEQDFCLGVHINSYGDIYTIGRTNSGTGLATAGAHQTSYSNSGTWDYTTFVAKYLSKDYIVGELKQPDSFCLGGSYTPAVYLYNVGRDTLKNLTVNYKLTGPSTVAFSKTIVNFYPGYADTLAFNNTVTPSKGGVYTAQVYIDSYDEFILNDSSIKEMLVVGDIPTTSFTFGNTCPEDSTKLINTSTVASGILSYEWNFGDSTTSGLKEPSHKYAKPGKYDIKLVITTEVGCKDSAIKVIEVYEQPSAEFNIADGCEGDIFLFNNHSSIRDSTVLDYVWYFGDGDSSISPEPMHIFQTSGEYTVSLKATSIHGCSDTVSGKVIVYQRASVDFSFKESCDGEAVVFINQSGITDSSNLDFTWYFGDGTASADSSPVHKYDSPGVYDVKLFAITAQGCVDSIFKTIKVHYRAKVDFSYTETCFGDEVNFLNLTTFKESASLTYTWHFGDGNTSADLSPVHLYDSAGTYDVKLLIGTAQGCVDSVIKTVKVHPRAKVDFLYRGTCLGEEVSFSNLTSITDTTTINYTWHFGDGSTLNDKNPLHKYDSLGSYEVILIAETSFGCRDSVTKTVTIEPRVTIDFTVGDSFLCQPGDITFINNSSSPAGSSYLSIVDFGDGTIDTVSGKTFSHHYKAGAYKARLYAITDKGCSDSSATISIVVHEKPVADLKISAPEVCEQDVLTFSNSSSYQGRLLSATWDFGDGNTHVSLKNESLKHIYSAQGQYQVTMTLQVRKYNPLVMDSADCSYTYIVDTVEVHPKPAISFTYQLGNNNGEVQFVPSIGTHKTYTWNFGDGNNSNLSSPTHTYGQEGTYNVKLSVISDEGCDSSYSEDIHVKFSGIAGNFPTSWKIYPNPAQDKIIIEQEKVQTEALIVTLHDITGKEVIAQKMNPDKKLEVVLPASVNPGIYTLRVIADGVYTTNIIVR